MLCLAARRTLTYAAAMTDLKPLYVPKLVLGDVSLTPVQRSDKDALRAAADAEDIWTWYSYRADGLYFDAHFWPRYFEDYDMEQEVHFVVRYKGEVVGSTCYLAINHDHKRVEIGGTWYTAAARGTVVNPTCKLLLIETAFGWGAQRVEWKTDSENLRSRAAIEKLGAQYEGILRNHMFLHDGRVRDTVYYSMIPAEWPAAKAKLEARIAALA